MTVRSFALSFDYRCPFAAILHRHVISALRAGADYHVEFVPWTLTQNYRVEGDPDVWTDPKRDSHLIALAAGVSVRDQQPDLFLDSHEALFIARHVDGVRLSTMTEVSAVLSKVGVNIAKLDNDLASRRPYDVIGENFRAYERYEAFGVPTMVIGNDAVFIRYMDLPTSDANASIELIDSLINTMTNQRSLNEFKHTQLSA